MLTNSTCLYKGVRHGAQIELVLSAQGTIGWSSLKKYHLVYAGSCWSDFRSCSTSTAVDSTLVVHGRSYLLGMVEHDQQFEVDDLMISTTIHDSPLVTILHQSVSASLIICNQLISTSVNHLYSSVNEHCQPRLAIKSNQLSSSLTSTQYP